MEFRRISRLVLVLVALVCLFAAFSQSAFGAGKPIAKQYSPEVSKVNLGPNTAEITAFVNPNGAATTATLEYRIQAGEWIAIASKEIGSGTEYVEFSALVSPLLQRQVYNTRVSATNSYGSISHAGGPIRLSWAVLGEGEIEEKDATSSYISNGTLKIAWTESGIQKRIECGSSGSGDFGPEAVSESLKLNTSGCAVYVNNTFQCSLKSITLNLNNIFQQSSTLFVDLCSEGMTETPISFSKSFAVAVASPMEWLSSHSVTMTTSGLVGSRTATITDSSTWQLSGKNAGKKFMLNKW